MASDISFTLSLNLFGAHFNIDFLIFDNACITSLKIFSEFARDSRIAYNPRQIAKHVKYKLLTSSGSLAGPAEKFRTRFSVCAMVK